MGVALTGSLAGSGLIDGLELPTPTAKVTIASGAAPKAAASAPKSKIAFLKDPKGKKRIVCFFGTCVEYQRLLKCDRS